MAYDKVIDSGKLNSALTATADAIRSKIGKTAQIAWNESTGFASDVNSISTGGSVTPSGVCQSLTITFTDYIVETIFASINGEYGQIYVGGDSSVIVEDIDIRTPIFTLGSLNKVGYFDVPGSENVDVLLLDEYGVCILECTSTEAAWIRIEVVE